MLLILIRHGETVDNVAGLYAGLTDSKLTNQGVLQASRLAKHLFIQFQGFDNVFTSDLQRAQRTAQAIVDHQNAQQPLEGLGNLSVTILPVLREQDFGSLERLSWNGRADLDKPKSSSWTPPESKMAMDVRANAFIDQHLMPLIRNEVSPVVDTTSLPTTKNKPETPSTTLDPKDAISPIHSKEFENNISQRAAPRRVAAVSHGMLLSRLWKCLLARCSNWSRDVTIASEVEIGQRGLEHLGSWSNTGFLVLNITPTAADAEPTREPAILLSKSSIRKETDNISSELLNDNKELFRPETLGGPNSHEHPTKPPASPNVPSTETSPQKRTEYPPIAPSATKLKISVQAVNVTEHLQGLKRTRGGLGSAAHDDSQKSIDSFFKKRRVN